MEKVRALERKIIRSTVVLLGALVFVAALVLRRVDVVLGLVFGGSIAILNFIELSRTLQRAVHKAPADASAYTTFKYFIRFVLSGVVLYVAAVNDQVDFLATAVGLLSVKLVVYATNLFNDRNFFKRIFERKED